MTSALEDRLTAALEARAEQVRPEDLRPLEVPATPRNPWRLAFPLLAAAATVAAIAVPFVLNGDDDAAPDRGPATSPPSASASVTVPAAFTEFTSVTGDLDGDGRDDDVRILTDGPATENPAKGFVEVTLATGFTTAATLPDSYAPDVLPMADLNGDGAEELLLRTNEGGDFAPLQVYTWVDDTVVQATTSGSPEIPFGYGVDGEGRSADHYVDPDRGLVTWLRQDLVSGTTYQVQEWTWELAGSDLTPTEAGTACFDVTSEGDPRPC